MFRQLFHDIAPVQMAKIVAQRSVDRWSAGKKFTHSILKKTITLRTVFIFTSETFHTPVVIECLKYLSYDYYLGLSDILTVVSWESPERNLTECEQSFFVKEDIKNGTKEILFLKLILDLYWSQTSLISQILLWPNLSLLRKNGNLIIRNYFMIKSAWRWNYFKSWVDWD